MPELSTFGVTNSAVRNTRRLIGAGRDLSNEGLRCAIEELLVEAMDSDRDVVSEWTDKNGDELLAVEFWIEGEHAVGVCVPSRDSNVVFACISVLHFNTASRNVANHKWRRKAPRRKRTR